MAGHDWELEAVCRTTDPEVFFPTAGESPERALAICWSCPVRVPCLEAAMAAERHGPKNGRAGVWGGLTPQERARAQTLRDAAARRAATPTPTKP